MASGRILLAAHNGYPRRLRPLDQPAQAGFEPRALRHPSVEHMPRLVVEPAAIGPPAEFFPQEQVSDGSRLQVSLQGMPVELRVEARERRGAHIGYRLDSMPTEDFHEDLDRMGRVTDGKESGTTRVSRISLVHAPSSTSVTYIEVTQAWSRSGRSVSLHSPPGSRDEGGSMVRPLDARCVVRDHGQPGWRSGPRPGRRRVVARGAR